MRVYGFPGQGSQVVGMGRGLFERFPEESAAADAILGYSVRDLCVEGDDERLGQTIYTQPAMYEVIARHPSVREQYQAKLVDAGVVDAETAETTIKAAQREIVTGGERARETLEILEMLLWRVLDAGAPLMRCVGGRDRTHRPGSGSAGLRIFLQQHDAAPQARGLGGCGEPGSTRAHHHHVEHFSAHFPRQEIRRR